MTAFVVLGIGLGILGRHAYAALLDSTGPNGDEFGTANAYYELSNTPDVKGATSMVIPVYYPHNTGAAMSINVTCKDGSGVVKVSGSGGGTICDGSGAHDFSIPAGSFSLDSNTGYWEHDVAISLTGGLSSGNYRAFKFNIKGGYADQGLIGYSASNTSKFAIANINRCDSGGDNSGCPRSGYSGYTTYTLPYGVPCNASVGSPDISLYDPDDGGSSGKYDIQPKQFTVTIQQQSPTQRDSGTWSTLMSNVKTTGTHGSVTVSGSFSGNGSTLRFSFTQRPGYRYKFILNGVYSNNVIQFHLPYDSINYLAQCTAGQFAGSASASCSGITGYVYDRFDNGAKVYYYLVANPAAGDPEASYANETEFTNDLDVYKGGLAQAATPKTSNGWSGHGFSAPVPTGTQHRYKGPWQPNTYYLYAREQGTSLVRKVDTMPVGPCATLSCGTSTFSAGIVGSTVTFTVAMKTNTYGAPPLPDNNFSVTVTPPTGANTGFSPGVSWSNAAKTITSGSMSYQITQAGNYKVTWVYNGKSCGDNNNQAGYAPYFNVLGGDIAAGAGVGNNGSCTGTTANIEGYNTNTGVTPNYAGAGSQVSALATGDITNFVSGMGLSGGPALQSGHALSFANTGAGVTASPPGYGGSFGDGSMVCIPDYYSSATGSDTGANFTQANIPGAAGEYSFNVDQGHDPNYVVTLGSGAAGSTMQIHAGQTINLYVYGNVYIKNNILYDAYSLTDTKTIPRFNLYVKGSIYIDPTVKELHGVYVAEQINPAKGGYIATCETGAGGAADTQSYATCANPLYNPLRIVGAVMAQRQIYMMRTYGNVVTAPGIPAQPSEVFQYTPELWLNAPISNTDLKLEAYSSLPPVL